MNVSSEQSTSLWMDTTVLDDAPALDRDEKADVVVVGSGIAGMSVAYELAKAGKDVVVIDRGPIGKGMTSRTTAHLTAQCDDGFDLLIKRRGEDIAKLWYESQAACIDRIEENQKDLGIDCDFRRLDGHLFHAPGTDPAIIDREFEATKKVGMPIRRETGVPLHGQEKTAALLYPNQATFHPLKYLAGLAQAIRKAGGRFYSETTVEEVEEDENGVEVKAGRHLVRARHAVVATNSPINDKYAIHTKQAPYRTYAMAFTLPKGALPDALYWDTLEAYHYVRLQPGKGKNDILIVGGADHKSGEVDDADARFLAIEAWMRNLLPKLDKETHRWSGQIQDPLDYCAFIGLNPGEKRTFIVTGDSGQGITHGTVAGMLISDLILKGESPLQEMYDPSRKPVKGIGTFLSENLTVPQNFAEYVAPGEISSLDELKPGDGAIVRQGLSKVAAFRDESGKLFLRSAACTHLGCHLHWNSFERCWDCPCHGSQFAPDGTALNGPAFAPLAEVKESTRGLLPRCVTCSERMTRTTNLKTRPFLSREEWLAKRQARRDRQREQNIARAAQMHEARLAHVPPPTKRQAAPKLSTTYVGCSGWFYWHWRDRFYPAGSKTGEWFAHYAKSFKTVELNAPFYAWPTVGTVNTWKKQSGRRRFVYTVKASELITHIRRFSRTAELVKDFGHIADLLGPAMGCFLFQLPPSFKYSRARLTRIVEQLDPRHRNVVEFRHRSWWNATVYAAFRERGIIFCSCSGPRLPDELVTTAENVYIRFHGTKKWYRHDYTREELRVWAERVRHARPARVWAYFNNDREGYAIKNARSFLRLLREGKSR